MAERGFLTIVFDPSFTGESGGYPRAINPPDINVEDFQAAVNFLSVQENVDPERIGIIGICGWGGMALQTACIDTRIKATVTSTMYDMSRIAGNGYFDSADSKETRKAARELVAKQRTQKYEIEIWINNAGFGLFSKVKGQDSAVINRMVDINVKALMVLSTLSVKKYQMVKGTSLINVSSGAGYSLYPDCVTYTASKFFVSSFTENLAHELRNLQAGLVVKLTVPEATETEFINIATGRQDKVNYANEFKRYMTSREMADYI